MKPAAAGTGVIAGGAARQILEAAGVKDVLAKSLGAPTHLNVARATVAALKGQRRPDEVAKLRGKQADDIVPPGLLAAYRSTESVRAVSGGS
jgi:small subunit ribosomal protein S5